MGEFAKVNTEVDPYEAGWWAEGATTGRFCDLPVVVSFWCRATGERYG